MSDFTPTQAINWDAMGAVGTVMYGNDQSMVVRFYKRAVRSSQTEIANGKEPWVSMDYVTIKEPNDRLHILDRPVTDLDKARWPRHWDAYQRQQEQIPDGTPLEMLFRNEPDIVKRLKDGGIHVIQQVADMSEHTMHGFGMGARTWKQRAEKFLETTGNHEHVAAMEKRLAELEAMVREAQAEKLLVQRDAEEVLQRGRRKATEAA